MDRIFMFQESYLKEDGGLDAKLLYEVVKKYCNVNLDKYIIVNEEQEDLKKLVEYNSIGKYKYIPVGGIDFVKKWLEIICGNNNMKPLEVPKELRSVLHRRYDILKGSDISSSRLNGKYFIKNASELKVWNNLLYYGMDIKHFIDNDTLYVVSDWIEFKSEYRVFVMDDKVLGCQNYLGDPITFPDRDYIHRVIDNYKKIDRPEAYTLDIGVYEDMDGNEYTDLIEIHPFVSCGLYGFQEKELLDMLEKGFKWYLEQNGVK